MRLTKSRVVAAATILLAAGIADAATYPSTLGALATFGNGDGYRAPAEVVVGDSTGASYPYLTTGTTERGLAYSGGHLYLTSRASGNQVRILDGTTGADLGGLNTTGISGGQFPINQVVTGGDGAIYVNNLTLAIGTGANAIFKIYKWDNEASTPSLVVQDTTSLAGARVGDDLAAIGSGTATRLVSGYNSSPTVAGNSGYTIINPSAGTSTAVAFTGTPPNAGDFKLGISFTDASHVIGSGTAGAYRYSSYSGGTGTLSATGTLTAINSGATAERVLAYATVQGVPLLAVQSFGDSHVSIYDVTNPGAPVFLTSGLTASGTLTTNSNGTGELAWGAIDNIAGNATLYALSSQQGLQAFAFTLPEPASMVALGSLGMVLGRRRR